VEKQLWESVYEFLDFQNWESDGETVIIAVNGLTKIK